MELRLGVLLVIRRTTLRMGLVTVIAIAAGAAWWYLPLDDPELVTTDGPEITEAAGVEPRPPRSATVGAWSCDGLELGTALIELEPPDVRDDGSGCQLVSGDTTVVVTEADDNFDDLIRGPGLDDRPSLLEDLAGDAFFAAEPTTGMLVVRTGAGALVVTVQSSSMARIEMQEVATGVAEQVLS